MLALLESLAKMDSKAWKAGFLGRKTLSSCTKVLKVVLRVKCLFDWFKRKPFQKKLEGWN